VAAPATRVLRSRVSELRPVYLPPDPASRNAYVVGEIAHCDQPAGLSKAWAA
jgi:hypothetical protein